MKKIILFLALTFILQESYSVTLTIRIRSTDHTPGNNYADAKRFVIDTYDSFKPDVLTDRTIAIFCTGNGQAVCPSNVVFQNNGENINVDYFPLSLMNAIQNIVNSNIVNFENNVFIPSSSSTLITPDGTYSYNLTVIQDASQNNKELKIKVFALD